MKEKGTDESLSSPKVKEVGLITCGRGESVQGVLTLFCSGAAQLFAMSLRVVRSSVEQLEVEEEDGDRQEEEEEEKGEVESKRCAP